MASAYPIPTFGELFRQFLRIGLLSFGGPAGQIALMHRELVDERQWISEADFLHALNCCHFLPGPEAQQLATWVGWRLYGWRGGLAAGLLFVIPGALVILALSMLYAVAASLDWFEALFLGVKAAVLAIVLQALLRIAGRSLDTPFKKGLALTAFLGLFLFDLPFPVLVLGAAALGVIVAAVRPGWLALKPGEASASAGPRPWRSTLLSIAIWGCIWALPMVVIAATLGRGHVLWDIGAFFSQLAVVTFGGAYAVLAYVAQEAVQGYGWLEAGEMADGLGLAETTPGPLILVTEFVGFLAAFKQAGIIAGIAGAAIALWATFVPCFLWIFAGAPYLDWLTHQPRLEGALASIMAAVVGVIANLFVWFTLHLMFAKTDIMAFGMIRVLLPDLASFDFRVIGITALCAWLAFGRNVGIFWLLGIAALAGAATSHIFP